MITEKYRPMSLQDVKGQSLTELLAWAKTWNSNNSIKSAFLYGPSGTGKTSTSYALANDMDWETLEINASDSRTAKEIETSIGHAIINTPFENRVLIIVDEADNITKSGFKELEILIDMSKNPIIITANDEYAIKRLTPYFRNESLLIHFKKLKDYEVIQHLQTIAKNENIQIKDLNNLIKASNGDMRYALTNLETSDMVEPKIQDVDIFNIIHEIFQGKWDGFLSGIELDFIWYSVRHNLINFYDNIYDYTVPDYIETVDRLFRRLYQTRSRDGRYAYRFMSYIIDMIKMLPYHQKTARIEIPKGTVKDIQNHFYPPNNDDYIKLERYLHCSYQKIKEDYLLRQFKVPINWEETARPSIKEYQDVVEDRHKRLVNYTPLYNSPEPVTARINSSEEASGDNLGVGANSFPTTPKMLVVTSSQSGKKFKFKLDDWV